MAYQFEKDQVVFETLSRLLQFNSVLDPSTVSVDHPFGEGATAALNYFLDLAEADGFRVKNLDNQVGYIEYGAGAGAGVSGGPAVHDPGYIGVLCHLDVVPAGNYWTEDPFGGRIAQDRIYGRGALDDKGPAVASYYALKALKDSGVVLNKGVRLILGLNEETGSACVRHYRKHEPDPVTGFTPDADFPVIYAEKGITTFTLSKEFVRAEPGLLFEVMGVYGGTAVNMVPDTCEATLVMLDEVQGPGVLDQAVADFNEEYDLALKYKIEGHVVSLTLRGVSAHASAPQAGRNAVSYMMLFLGNLPLGEGDLVDTIHQYVDLIGLEVHGASIGMGLWDEVSGKLTLNVGTVHLDQDGFRVAVNVRYPVTARGAEVYNAEFKRLVGSAGFTVAVDHDVDPIVHDVNGPLVTTLMAVYKEHTGDTGAEPLCIGGGTYARSMPGIVAFGPLFKHTEDTMHQADEYITKADLLAMVGMFADAIARLDF